METSNDSTLKYNKHISRTAVAFIQKKKRQSILYAILTITSWSFIASIEPQLLLIIPFALLISIWLYNFMGNPEIERIVRLEYNVFGIGVQATVLTTTFCAYVEYGLQLHELSQLLAYCIAFYWAVTWILMGGMHPLRSVNYAVQRKFTRPSVAQAGDLSFVENFAGDLHHTDSQGELELL